MEIALTINGQKVSCPSGISILNAAEKIGIKIPVLCYHPDLKPYGACRVCLVEDEKTGRLMASCVTPAAQDMSIITNSPRVLNHRKNIVRLMMAEHPESCIVCSKGNRCELRKIAASLGVGEHGLYPMPNYTPYEQMNPFIIRDLSKCILCGKCIRADHELVATYAIDYNHRGFQSRPATLYEKPLEDSICTFCGTCVSICPTGALSAKNTKYVGTPEKEIDSICCFCGVGCSLSVGVTGPKVVDVNPSKRKISVNRATLCLRGHFANDFIYSADRLTQPMVKSADEQSTDTFLPVSWDEALEVIARRLFEISNQYGPESIAFVGSSKCTNEENYLFQKIAREIVRTKNVLNGGYTSGHKLLSYIDEKTFGIFRVMPLTGLEDAEVIVAVNTDLEHTVPVAGYHVKRAAKKGAKVIVIDPVRSDLVAHSSVWIQPELSSSGHPMIGDFLNVLAKEIIDTDSHNQEFIDQHTKGFENFHKSLSNYDSQRIAEHHLLYGKLACQTAELIKGRKLAFIFDAESLCSPDGFHAVDAILHLLFLTGSIGDGGSGIYVAVPENNLVGALDMGTVTNLLPGRKRISSEKDFGLDPDALVVAMETGKIKAAYILGENLLRSLPQKGRVEAALQSLEFLVVQDIVSNRTTRLAELILPGAASFEKSGSFTNMEGRIQSFEPVVPPPGHAVADWDILARIIKQMGYPDQYRNIEQIRKEIRKQVPMYQNLGKTQNAWIQNSKASNLFLSKNAKFSFQTAIPEARKKGDGAYPFVAKISSVRFHLGSGTRTSRSERIQAYDRKGEIEISETDCRNLGLDTAGRVRVTSSFGSIEREFKENRYLPDGVVLIPKGVNNNDAMDLKGLVRKSDSDFSGSAFTRVKIERVI